MGEMREDGQKVQTSSYMINPVDVMCIKVTVANNSVLCVWKLLGLIPGSGRSPGEGNGCPLQYSCLENSMDGGDWLAIAKSYDWATFTFNTLPHPQRGLTRWKWSEVTQSCLTLCNPVDCSPPGSSVHGILQARILEWDAVVAMRSGKQTHSEGQCR